LNFYKVY